jgi:hypothetical protein
MAVAIMAQGDASKMASNLFGPREKQSLLAMKALIEQHLKEIEERGVGETGDGRVEKQEEEDIEMAL